MLFFEVNMTSIGLLFENVLKHSTLAGPHPTTHEEEDRTSVFMSHRNHHICALWIIKGYKSNSFHLLHQCGKHSSHLQILCYPLDSLFSLSEEAWKNIKRHDNKSNNFNTLDTNNVTGTRRFLTKSMLLCTDKCNFTSRYPPRGYHDDVFQLLFCLIFRTEHLKITS